jgi:O-antigen ligase
MNSPDLPVTATPSGTSGSPDQPEQRGANRLQLITLLHVASLVVFISWDFGGETDFARTAINGWGLIAAVILGIACTHRWKRHRRLPASLRWLWPLALFNLLVIVSAQNPSFTHAIANGATVWMNRGGHPGWPSSAQPVLSLQALGQFDAIFLTCFNLLVVVFQRRLLRWLLYVFTVNSLLLAVMGTFQKLAHAPGLYFGAVHSPNETFFASFIYHNHWGAFTLLATAAALGLHFHHVRNRRQDRRKHSPAFFGLVATLFIAASVPLSTSRSCTVLLLVLLMGALFGWLRLCRRNAQADGRSMLLPMTLSVGVFAVGLGAILLLSQPVIEARLDTTRQQVEDLRRRGDFGARQQLYADTWHMARDKPWFGWGLGSYATVFRIYNSQYAVEPWFGQTFYAEAHSDWLQSIAEVGLIGTGLLVLLGLLPLVSALRHSSWDELPRSLLAGCGLIALYAWVEFPFANPAVMLAFWLCFFTAVRYHKLTVHH